MNKTWTALASGWKTAFQATVFSIKIPSTNSGFSGICSHSELLSRDWLPVCTGMFLVRSNHSTLQFRGSSLSTVHQLLRALLPLSVPPPRETGSSSQFHSHSFINPHSCQSVLPERRFTLVYCRNSESSSSHPILSQMLPFLHIKVKYRLIPTLVIHAN